MALDFRVGKVEKYDINVKGVLFCIIMVRGLIYCHNFRGPPDS